MTFGSWNLNKSFGDEIIIPRIQKIDESSERGDHIGWFNNLRILYRNIRGHPKINKKTIEEISKSMDELKSEIKMLDKAQKQNKLRKIENIKEELDKINLNLISEIYTAKILFPTAEEKEITEGMKAYIDKYLGN